MTRVYYLWSGLIGLCAVFFLWHQPLKGPLTEDELAQYFERRAGPGGGEEFSDIEEMLSFFLEDDGRPFVMFNLLDYSEMANYSEGQFEDITTGDAASVEYAKGVLPLLLKRGSYPVMIATRQNTILNSVTETELDFDAIALVRYRSRRDLLDMITSEAFANAEIHKWASLDATLVAPSKRGPSVNFAIWVPFTLLIVGTLGSFALLPRRVNT